jgi:endonuclease/exonuclease/phosphatase family metal-dependent hydrolase
VKGFNYPNYKKGGMCEVFLDSSIRVLGLNFKNNLIEIKEGLVVGPPIDVQEQISRVAELGADVICAQEVVGRHLDLCTRLLGPECATRQIRYLGFPALDTRQLLAIFSPWPINRECSTNLGTFQADGEEPTSYHVGLGRRGLEATILAAEIVHPSGNFWATTAHLAWTERAHESLKPHQIETLNRTKGFLEELYTTGYPVILGADFNALLVNCAEYLPSWMYSLISDRLRNEVGTSIDVLDPDKAKRLKENVVYVDGIFASEQFKLEGEAQVITGLSDHKGHIATLYRI